MKPYPGFDTETDAQYHTISGLNATFPSHMIPQAFDAQPRFPAMINDRLCWYEHAETALPAVLENLQVFFFPFPFYFIFLRRRWRGRLFGNCIRAVEKATVRDDDGSLTAQTHSH